MALIFCPSCGTQVSDKAEKCIKCGFEIQKRIKHDFLLKSNTKPLDSKLNKNKQKSSRNHFFEFIVFCVVAFFVYIKFERNESKNKSNNENTHSSSNYNSNSPSNESIKNTCSICGSLFTGSGYEETSNGIWKKCEDPYQCFICSPTCGRKHTDKMNGYTNSTRGDLNDGRLYESSSCGLCKGTGVETGYDAFTREYNSRTCPMCDGKGVRGY